MPKSTFFIAPNVCYDRRGNVVIEATTTTEVHGIFPQKPAREWRMPRVRIPHIRIPRVHIPEVTLPQFSLPAIDRQWIVRRMRLGTRFGGTFVTIFVGLFILFNVPSYYQIAKATLFPSSDQGERQKLQAMVNPVKNWDLLSAPELPKAGPSIRALFTESLVAPPDDRLIIPKINLNVPIVQASDAALLRGDQKTFNRDIQHALKFGILHYPGTAFPGEIGNVFLTGHSSNLPWIRSKYNAVLALLPQLEIGDEYAIFYQGRRHRYRVTEKFEVSPKDVSVLSQPRSERISTLMTCTPVGTTLRRLIVRAEEVVERHLQTVQNVTEKQSVERVKRLPI